MFKNVFTNIDLIGNNNIYFQLYKVFKIKINVTLI